MFFSAVSAVFRPRWQQKRREREQAAGGADEIEETPGQRD
jgi:hypothetical protein